MRRTITRLLGRILRRMQYWHMARRDAREWRINAQQIGQLRTWD